MCIQSENFSIFVVDNVCLVDINCMMTELSASGTRAITNLFFLFIRSHPNTTKALCNRLSRDSKEKVVSIMKIMEQA